MNKAELSQLGYLNKEIEMLKRDLKDAEFLVEAEATIDSVKGSSSCFPYAQHIMKISGINIRGYERKVKRLKDKLEVRINELIDKAEAANEYIASIEDSETRMILQCKYVNRLTWEQMEEELGINQRTLYRKFKKWYENNL